MKRFVLILVVVCISTFSVHSQKLWEKVLSDSQFNKSEYKSSVLVNDTILVFSGRYNVMSECYKPMLLAYNHNGEFLWEAETMWGKNYPGMTDFVATDGSFIYACGAPYMDDVIGYDEPLYLRKLSLSGEVITDITYFSPEADTEWFFPSGIDLLSGQFQLVSAGEPFTHENQNRIAKFDLDGNVIWDKTLDFVFEQALFAPDGKILVRTESAIHIADEEGMIISEIPLENPLVDMLVLGNSVLALTNNEAFEIDLQQPAVIKNIQNPPVEGASFITAKMYANEVWLLSADNENAYVENISSETTELYTLSLPAYSVIDFEISPEKIFLTGTYPPFLLGILAYSREQFSPVVNWYDAEISDFELSNMKSNFINFGDEWFLTGFTFDTQIEVSNFSPEPLTDFALYSERPWLPYCSNPQFYKDISIESLAQSELRIEDVGTSMYYFYWNFETNLTVCYQLIAPNGRMERNIENNIVCKNYDFTDVENLAQDNKWQIFPNPVQKQLLTIQSPGQVSFLYKLYSLDGRIVSQNTASHGIHKLDVSALPAGLYILETEANNQRVLNKIVIQ